MPKIHLFLVGYKGFDVLKYLSSLSYFQLIGSVLIGEDSGIKDDCSVDIKTLCIDLGVPYMMRCQASTSLNWLSPEDIVICIGWKWLVSSTNKVIVLHDSLLPLYRGFAPLVSQLINGDKLIGVTAIYASANYDCGPIICQSSIEIDYPIKIKNAIELITECYKTCISFIFDKVSQAKILPTTMQNDNEATYSLWRDSLDYFIDWRNDASYIKRFIDAVGEPYDGASCYLNNQVIKILESEVVPDKHIVNRTPGKIIFVDQGFPTIVCATGLLRILKASDQSNENILPLARFKSRFY